eukprot:230562_1
MAKQIITDNSNHCSRSPRGRLHFEVLPEAHRLKKLLCDGYTRNIANSMHVFIPTVISTICAVYYDEVTHWQIDYHDLKPYYKTDDHFKSQIFTIDNVQMQCSLHYKKEGETYFYLNVLIPKGVEQILVYSEIYCNENKAHFRYIDPYVNEDDEEAWYDSEYGMWLNCQDFECINISYYIEILLIEYVDGTHAYAKPITMQKEVRFRWNFDETMVNEFKTNDKQQMYLSKTFDEYNHNWGLWIVPLYGTGPRDTRDVILTLSLFRKPIEIEEITIKYKVQIDYKNIEIMDTLTFTGEDLIRNLQSPFESHVLDNIDTFAVTMHIAVCSVKDKNGIHVFE